MSGSATEIAPPVPHLRRQFPGLDGLRAIGAAFVLTTHVGFHSGASLNSSFNGVLSRMDTGVAIFFVISGFLLYRPHASSLVRGGRTTPTGRYFWHRALRILPALWVAVVAAALLVPHNAGIGVMNYLRHALLVQVYAAGSETNGLTQMWSLATEAAFYLVLPLAAWLMARRATPVRSGVIGRLAALLALPLVGATWMALSAAGAKPQWGLWLPGYVGWFALGMAMALWSVARGAGVFGRSALDALACHPWTVWGVAGGLYLVLASPVAGPYDLTAASPGEAATKNLLYGVFGTLVVFPAIAGLRAADDPAPIRALGGRVGKFLGDISYGVFCYHLIVLAVVERVIGFTIFTGRFWTLLTATAVSSVAVATLSFYGLERPIMRWGRRGELSGAHAAEAMTTATATTVAS